ncbi:hypothetical protein TNCV_3564571 [Trichonephila clavipes]|nr:hypothetical protein TNCV_3564571 [Trichonephila clavipes]
MVATWKRYEPTHFVERQTVSIMVWGGVMFDHRVPVVVYTDLRLTADCKAQFGKPVVLPLLQDTRSTVFRQDNAKSHVALKTPKTALLDLTSFTGWRTL